MIYLYFFQLIILNKKLIYNFSKIFRIIQNNKYNKFKIKIMIYLYSFSININIFFKLILFLLIIRADATLILPHVK